MNIKSFFEESEKFFDLIYSTGSYDWNEKDKDEDDDDDDDDVENCYISYNDLQDEELLCCYISRQLLLLFIDPKINKKS
jgi:hypothetical protein